MAGIQEAFNNFVNRVAQKEQSKTLPKVMIEIPQQHPHIQDMGIMKKRFGLSSGGQPPVTTGFEGLPPISDTPPPPQQVNPNTYALRNTAQTQGFVQSNQPTSSYPTATPLTQGLPLYFNQSVTGGAINPLSYLSQGNNLLSATPDQIVQQNNQKQQQAIAAAPQGIGQQSPTWYGAKGGRAGYADGSEELDPNLERLSKSKSYSEKELLSNLNAKMSNRPTLEDIIYYGSPMVEPSYIVPKNSTSNMPVIREGTMNFPMQQLADGGQVETHLTTTTPPQHGPNPYGVASMFKQRYT